MSDLLIFVGMLVDDEIGTTPIGQLIEDVLISLNEEHKECEISWECARLFLIEFMKKLDDELDLLEVLDEEKEMNT